MHRRLRLCWYVAVIAVESQSLQTLCLSYYQGQKNSKGNQDLRKWALEMVELSSVFS